MLKAKQYNALKGESKTTPLLSYSLTKLGPIDELGSGESFDEAFVDGDFLQILVCLDAMDEIRLLVVVRGQDAVQDHVSVWKRMQQAWEQYAARITRIDKQHPNKLTGAPPSF